VVERERSEGGEDDEKDVHMGNEDNEKTVEIKNFKILSKSKFN
jgi:hypothetical protein